VGLRFFFPIDYRRRALGRALQLPSAFDAEGLKAAGFGLVEVMLEDAIDAATAGTLVEAGAEFGEVFGLAGGDDFDVAFFGVADPAAQGELTGFAVNEPAKSDTLYTPLNEEVKDHGRSQFCRRAGTAATHVTYDARRVKNGGREWPKVL
jgi:hypothetical protein